MIFNLRALSENKQKIQHLSESETRKVVAKSHNEQTIMQLTRVAFDLLPVHFFERHFVQQFVLFVNKIGVTFLGGITTSGCSFSMQRCTTQFSN